MLRPPLRPRQARESGPALLVGPGDALAPTAAERAAAFRAAQQVLAFVTAVREAPEPPTPAGDGFAIRLLLATDGGGIARADGMAGFTGIAGLTGHQSMAVAATASDPAPALRALVADALPLGERLNVWFTVSRRAAAPTHSVGLSAHLIVRLGDEALDGTTRCAIPLDGPVPAEEALAARLAALRAVLSRGRLFADPAPQLPGWWIEAEIEGLSGSGAGRLRCVVRAADAVGAVAEVATLAAERLDVAGALHKDRAVRFRTLALEPGGIGAAIAAAGA